MDSPKNKEAIKIAARLEEIATEAMFLRVRFDEICEAGGIDKRSIPFYDEPEKISEWVARHGFTWMQYVSSKKEAPRATLETLYSRYERKMNGSPKRKRKDRSFFIHDEKFLSVEDFAERMGIEKGSVYSYASRDGVDVMEECRRIYEKKKVPRFFVDKRPFFTKKDIAIALGIKYDRVCRYINAHKRKKHFTEEEIRAGVVQKPVSVAAVRVGKEVCVDGHVWPSQSAFARDMGFSSVASIYCYAKKHGMTPLERIIEVYHGINCRKGNRGTRKGGDADGSRCDGKNQRNNQECDVQES